MGILAGQLNRLKQVPKSNELGVTINEFLGMMEEVVDFIQKWLENWTRTYQFIWDGFFTESVVPVKHILVAVQKGKAIELRDNLDAFADKFDRALLIEIFVEQGLVSYSLPKWSDSWYQTPYQMTSSPYMPAFQIFKVGCLWSIVSIRLLKILYHKMKKQSQRRRNWMIWWALLREEAQAAQVMYGRHP